MVKKKNTAPAIIVQNDYSPVAVKDIRTIPAVFEATASRPEFARSAWDTFKSKLPKNGNTAKAYLAITKRFAGWMSDNGLELLQLKASDIQDYVESLTVIKRGKGNVFEVTDISASPPTKKLHLSAIRKFMDFCVTSHAIYINPALSVRLDPYSAEGKTPEITVKKARKLLQSIDAEKLTGKRDKAIIATMIYTACRTSVISRLRIKDFYYSGEQYIIRVREKGGKSREIPVRHDLEQYLFDYLESAGIQGENPNSPLFRSVVGKTNAVTKKTLQRTNVWHMLKRRYKNAGLPSNLCGHSFRVTTITDLIEQGVGIEDVQNLAGHADPRTTRIYDRTKRKVTRNIVERISI